MFFVLGAASGQGQTLTAYDAATGGSTTNFFEARHEGGSFVALGATAGASGIARIVTVSSPPTSAVTVDILQTFDASAVSNRIRGQFAFIGEPAWSDARGWPRKCSSFQSRAVFANTESIPNGVWLSDINGFTSFNDLETDADNAISWQPTSDSVNYINFLVPYRTLTVHTNSGVYSSPLTYEQAVTPGNFSLQLQDSTPADTVQPRSIDNQILIVSGNDVHSLIWDGINNAYGSNIISAASEHLIRSPVDEAAYVDLERAGSRYMFLVNSDGSLAIYQTLIAQDVAGWTPAVLEQPYGEAYFRWVASNFDGRAWFFTERQIAEADTPIAIDTYTPTPPDTYTTDITSTGHGLDVGVVYACEFTTGGTLLTSTPQIATDTYYWVVASDADTMSVYTTLENATDGVEAIEFNLIPASNNLVPWPLTTKFYVEELSYDVVTDCSTEFNGTATDTITGLERFNTQLIKMQGDGYGFENTVIDDEFDVVAHGDSVEVEQGFLGFPINWKLVTMPISISLGKGIKSTNVVEPKHVRSATFMFADTIAGTINGYPIKIESFNGVAFGAPPNAATGIYKLPLMKGWDDFNNINITIEQNEPFQIKLLGVFYKVEV